MPSIVAPPMPPAPVPITYLELEDEIAWLVTEPADLSAESSRTRLGRLGHRATYEAIPPRFLKVYLGWIYAMEDSQRDDERHDEEWADYRGQVEGDWRSARGL